MTSTYLPALAKPTRNAFHVLALPGQREGTLILSVPNGWDDVKRLTGRVITFAGRTYAFTGWNSDHLHAYFIATSAVVTL